MVVVLCVLKIVTLCSVVSSTHVLTYTLLCCCYANRLMCISACPFLRPLLFVLYLNRFVNANSFSTFLEAVSG